MDTVRSQDQFNTIIYRLNDRYRGVRGNRMVLFMNAEDPRGRGLENEQAIVLETISSDGVAWRVEGLTVLDYPIARGAVAGYYTELEAPSLSIVGGATTCAEAEPASTDAMQRHIDEIALHVTRGAHAVLLLNRAGWHTTGNLVWPKIITPVLLPSRSPELNPVEQVWQYLSANYLSNRVFHDFDAIIDAACGAWRKLLVQPQQITLIGMRTCAHKGHL